jgi:DNA-binding XRE family transcriptional regulator
MLATMLVLESPMSSSVPGFPDPPTRLRALRESMGMTCGEFATLFGSTRSMISAIENRTRVPYLELAVEIQRQTLLWKKDPELSQRFRRRRIKLPIRCEEWVRC